MTEPTITINGVKLTPSQAAAVRMGVSDLIELSRNEEFQRRMLVIGPLYHAALKEVHALMASA